MRSKISVVKPLFAIVLFTVMVIEFLFLSLFYDMDFDFIIYQPEPGSQIHSSIPIYGSPATLIVLKHECFFARVEVRIHPTIDSKVTLSLPGKGIINLSGEEEYVFTTVLPGEFPLYAYYGEHYINDHYVSTDKPVEVFLEESKLTHPCMNNSNLFILANITVISGHARVEVKVWGVML